MTSDLLEENQDLRKQVAELENKNIELLGKIAFTENALNNAKAQIEKMKCCGNCYKELVGKMTKGE